MIQEHLRIGKQKIYDHVFINYVFMILFLLLLHTHNIIAF